MSQRTESTDAFSDRGNYSLHFFLDKYSPWESETHPLRNLTTVIYVINWWDWWGDGRTIHHTNENLWDFKCLYLNILFRAFNIVHLGVKFSYTTNMLFSFSPFKPCTVIQAILSLPFINSCTPFSDVGYARTCVGESLNELSLAPFFPPSPSPVPSTSYYWISIKSLRLVGEPGLYGKRLWRGGTTARVREDSMAQKCTDSLKSLSLEIGTTYLYSKLSWSLRDLRLR